MRQSDENTSDNPGSFELKQLRFKLFSRCSKAMKDYGLVEDGDKILIGLSGGWDSLVLADMMAMRAAIFKPAIKVEAVHVVMKGIGYESDKNYLESFCEKRGIMFHYKESEFPADGDKTKSPCFLCSWNRRKKLFETAEERECNKIALGHHQDDIIKTMLMNMVFQGAFATMPPLLEMDKMPVSIIRPLCTCEEAKIKRYAELCGFEKQIKTCPYEKESNRDKMNDIFSLMQKLNPEARHSLWGALSNIQEHYLPNKKQQP